MFISTYKELKFWQSAKKVSVLTINLCKLLPNERVAWVITDQLLRSSFSVGANISEGFGKFKGKEYPRFLLIALGSANETEYWLELLQEAYPQISEQTQPILSKNTETIKMLSAAVKSLRSKQ